jgi:hypothetical protein
MTSQGAWTSDLLQQRKVHAAIEICCHFRQSNTGTRKGRIRDPFGTCLGTRFGTALQRVQSTRNIGFIALQRCDIAPKKTRIPRDIPRLCSGPNRSDSIQFSFGANTRVRATPKMPRDPVCTARRPAGYCHFPPPALEPAWCPMTGALGLLAVGEGFG